jgi:hypothetical protein
MTTLTKTISLLLVGILLFSLLSAKSCPMNLNLDQKRDVSAHSCCVCCANSSTSLLSDNASQHNCSCQMTEKPPEDRSPAIIISHDDSKSETFLVTSQVEVISKDHLSQPIFSSPHFFPLSSRDRPLYLLYSTLLI